MASEISPTVAFARAASMARASRLSSSEPEPERGPGRAGTGTPWRSGVLTEEDIDACLFRMFALHEIAGAMAMRQHLDGAEYVVLGNKRERMRLMGNAVTPPAMALIVGRLLEVLG